MDEITRIRQEYQRRERCIPADFYSVSRPANLFAEQQLHRWLLRVLAREGLLPLAGKRILDVGCGEGQRLVDLVHWGAAPSDLAGIDLLEQRVARATRRFHGGGGPDSPDLRVGDAAHLPWADATFDVIIQTTVFTSIVDAGLKAAAAAEILRVLKPGGVVIWYDFLFNNPRNPHVRGIGAREIRALFAGCRVWLTRITLAPPLARRLVPLSWIGALVLERLSILNTHYLGAIRKQSRARASAKPTPVSP